MAKFSYIPNRVIDTNGISDGANIYFYTPGTTTPVTIYSDAGFTTPVSNPYPVSSGAAVPALYHNESGGVRVKVVDSSGNTVSDDDPWSAFAADVVSTATGDDLQNTLDGYATRAALKAITSYAGARAFLTESGREGEFVFRSGDYSTEVAADASEGIYIKADDTASASGAWVRQYKDALSVKWFGAMGDGSTDDSAAIQAACNLANALGDSSQWPGSSTFASVAPAVMFPKGGIYRVNSTISIEQHRFVKLISDGRALIVGDTSGTKTTTLFDGTGVRYLEVDGLQFNNINAAFVVSSGNLNSSKYTFQNVICDSTTLFLDTETYALSRSTIVNFDHCVFESDVVQVAQAYVDVINVRDCWIAARSSTTDTFYVNSLINFDGCIFIPAGTTAIGGAWVRLTEDDGEAGTAIEEHRGVHFSGCRFSNEGSNHTIVVNDYGVVNEVDANTPNISFHACSINGFHGSMYESGNSESGIVYLLQYPASISFKDCGFYTIGNAEGALVAKSDTLTAAPEDGFLIDVDDLSFSSAMRSVGATTSKLVARSLRSYIRNPDPYTFRDILEDGHLEVVSTATTGQKKATFTIQTGWTDASSRTPITFLLYLGGQGRTGGTTNIQYAGASVYLVTIAGVFVSAAHQSEISFTKLHGGTFGNGNTSNCDIISMHFGTADTGSTLAPLATSHDVTVAFGTQIEFGIARVEPGFRKWLRYWDQLRG